MSQTPTTAPGVGDPAPDVTVRTIEDQPIQLSAFWRERPTVIVFVRHFG